jgi:hypothetical protein
MVREIRAVLTAKVSFANEFHRKVDVPANGYQSKPLVAEGADLSGIRGSSARQMESRNAP